jgi:putative beta-lysine N-acetyltransferase
MDENIVYFCIWKGSELAAVSSCEIDMGNLNVEMTDFAVLPKYRGRGLSLFLLGQMNIHMKQNGIKTAYTIARANSFGMNSTFSKCGYSFAGRLVKNTQIGGSIEDMNVWYKQL